MRGFYDRPDPNKCVASEDDKSTSKAPSWSDVNNVNCLDEEIED